MNKVILMGRLTRTPDIRYSQNGENQMLIARFSLAVDRRFGRREGEQNADFISCVAFGKSAEFVEKYLDQGTKVVAEGRIQTGSYTNRDGQKVYTSDVIIENLEFAESKNARDGAQGADTIPPRPVPAPAPNANADGFMNIPDGVDDEGLPFA